MRTLSRRYLTRSQPSCLSPQFSHPQTWLRAPQLSKSLFLPSKRFIQLVPKTVPEAYQGHGRFHRSVTHLNKRTTTTDIVLYVLSLWLTFLGFAYASAPLYRMLCQRFGWGGAVNTKIDNKLKSLVDFQDKTEIKGRNRKLLIRFDARTGPGMPWEFEPVQSYVVTRPGDSTLAFFSATNTSPNPMAGLSTYTVLPFKAAPYFLKIQCFCFEEQRLRGHETVDMPVLFFVDPAILEDEKLHDVEEITLAYIFYPVVDEGGDFEDDDFDDEFWDDEDDLDVDAPEIQIRDKTKTWEPQPGKELHM